MRWALALALAGCFGKPGFSGRDAAMGDDDGSPGDGKDAPGSCTPSKPSARGLAVDTDPTNTRITMLDGSEIGFRNQLNRYPFVDRLIVSGQDLVATPEGCAYEDQIGVAAFPVYTIGGQSVTAGNVTHAFDVLDVGAAYTRIQTHWTVPIDPDCGASQTSGSGNTTWAFYPDGKIVRNDTITPTVNSTITPGPSCNCSGAIGAGSFIVTSYATFEASRLAAVTRTGEAEATSVPPTSGGVGGACARGTSGGKVAVYWDRLDNNDPTPPPTRIRHETNPGNSHEIVAFVYDMVSQADNAMSMSPGVSYGIRTHMLVHSGTQPCTALLGEVESFAAIQPLMVTPAGGAAQPVSYSANGFFDDLTAYSGPITIRGAAPEGFAIHLRFPGFTAIATDRMASRVVWQRDEGDGTFTLFFLDGLGPQTAITVTPECSM